MAKSKLSMKRKAGLLDALMEEISKYLEGSDVLECFEDKTNWRIIFSNLTDNAEVGEIFPNAMDAAGIGDDEMDDLIFPYLAHVIDRSINRSNVRVAINWKYKPKKKAEEKGAD